MCIRVRLRLKGVLWRVREEKNGQRERERESEREGERERWRGREKERRGGK